MVGLQSPEVHKAVLNGCRQCEDRAVSGCIQQWVRREERGWLPSSASQCPVWANKGSLSLTTVLTLPSLSFQQLFYVSVA